jgi:hypothetical protein
MSKTTDERHGRRKRYLANLGNVGAREAFGDLGQMIELHRFGDGRVAQHCFEDLTTRREIWQRNVDQLIESARSQNCAVDLHNTTSQNEKRQYMYV